MPAGCSFSLKITDFLSLCGERGNRGVLMSFKAEHADSFPGKGKVRRWHVSPQWTEAWLSGVCSILHLDWMLSSQQLPGDYHRGHFDQLAERGDCISSSSTPLWLLLCVEDWRQVSIASLTQPFWVLLLFGWNWGFRSDMPLTGNFRIGLLLKGKATYRDI